MTDKRFMTLEEFSQTEEEFCNEATYTSYLLAREAKKLEVDYDEIIDLLQSLLGLAFKQRDHKKEIENGQ
jgi:hypothetical protein